MGSWVGFRRGRNALFGLFLVVADGCQPTIDAEGADELMLGELHGLNEGLAQIGEGGCGFGFDVALGDGGEEPAKGGAQIASGNVAAGKVVGDVLAGLVAGEVLGFFAGVEGAEVRMTVAAGRAALAAIGKGERTEGRTVLVTRSSGAISLTCGRTAAV